MIEVVLGAWVIATALLLSVLSKEGTSRRFFWVGCILILTSVIAVIILQLILGKLSQIQETAMQLLLITGAAVGGNLIAYSFTVRQKA